MNLLSHSWFSLSRIILRGFSFTVLCLVPFGLLATADLASLSKGRSACITPPRKLGRATGDRTRISRLRILRSKPFRQMTQKTLPQFRLLVSRGCGQPQLGADDENRTRIQLLEGECSETNTECICKTLIQQPYFQRLFMLKSAYINSMSLELLKHLLVRLFPINIQIVENFLLVSLERIKS